MQTILFSALALGALTSVALADELFTLTADQMDKVTAGAGGCGDGQCAVGVPLDNQNTNAFAGTGHIVDEEAEFFVAQGGAVVTADDPTPYQGFGGLFMLGSISDAGGCGSGAGGGGCGVRP